MLVSINSKLRVFAFAIVLALPGVAAADTASCLSDCTKAFVACQKDEGTTFADCLKLRKQCIESCGNASD
ncbi:MAG: hypothetical protein ABIN68_01225 [Sphingomicrobium sp.]